MTTIVVMPGGFHPFHAGHAALYQSARRAFPNAEVFVAATNDTSSRPFPFAVKEKLAKLAGVEPGHFVQVKSPFRAEEITSRFNPEQDVLIFVRSEKDENKPPQAGGVKKDGAPAYLQRLEDAQKLEPFAKHAYMAYLPTVEFGPGMTSATEIRAAWPQLDERRKTALVMSLYPQTQKNPALAATVVKMLDVAIGAQGVAEGSADSAEKYKAHLIKTAPRVMDFLAKSVEGWRPSEQEMSNAIETAYMVMKHTGDVKQAGKAMVDELNTLHRMSQGQQGVAEGSEAPPKHHTVRVSYHKEGDPHRRYEAIFKTTHNGGKEETEKRAKAAFAAKKKIVYDIVHEQGVAEGAPIVVAQAPIHIRNPKKAPQPFRNQGDIVPDTKPPSTEKRGVKGRPGQRPMPDYTKDVDENQGWAATYTSEESGQMAGTPAVGGMWAGYQQRENQPVDEDYIEEKWSAKYKSSINCANPQGFSQRAHCAGRKK